MFSSEGGLTNVEQKVEIQQLKGCILKTLLILISGQILRCRRRLCALKLLGREVSKSEKLARLCHSNKIDSP